MYIIKIANKTVFQSPENMHNYPKPVRRDAWNTQIIATALVGNIVGETDVSNLLMKGFQNICLQFEGNCKYSTEGQLDQLRSVRKSTAAGFFSAYADYLLTQEIAFNSNFVNFDCDFIQQQTLITCPMLQRITRLPSSTSSVPTAYCQVQ